MIYVWVFDCWFCYDRFLWVSQRSCTSSTLKLYFSIKACLLSCRWSFVCYIADLNAIKISVFCINNGIIVFIVFIMEIWRRPPPSQWSSSPTPASSRVPGHRSSGSTWSVRTQRWAIPMTNIQHLTYNIMSPFCSYGNEFAIYSMCWFGFLFQDIMFFANCPAATWLQFAEMLSWQFLAATQRGLNADQLAMIADKLFGKSCLSVLH